MPALDRTTGFYSDLETETSEQRAARAWTAVTRLVARGWEKSREFRSRMETAGLAPADIRSWEQWTRIPKFSKKELIAFQQTQGLYAMLGCDVGALSRIYMSPGPIFDPEGRGRDHWGWTEAFYAAGFRPGDVAQMTFGYHLTPAGLMLEEPLRELGCAVIPAGPGNTAVQIELLTKLPVTGFVGMASYLKIIKDTARGQGLDLGKDFKLAVAFVAAERLTDSLRAELECELRMRVRQGYGTADVGCIAYECQELGGMHLSSRCCVEIVDP
jgi:phenylacetate-CoA ligase